MAKRTHASRTGAFITGAVVLIVAAIVIFGSKGLFERKYRYVCYFPGSVLGLVEGAPVKYRGVDVGVAKEIKLRFRQAPEDRRIPVFIELWGKRLEGLGADVKPPELIPMMVEKGLRARLASLSLVTGVTYISLEELPDTPPVYSELPGVGAVPEIPAAPTEFEEVTKSVSDLLAHLSSTDFKAMADSVSNTMNGVNDLVTSDDLHRTLAKLPPLVADVNRLAKALNTDADKAGHVIDDASGALAALHGALQGVQGTVSPQAPLSTDLSLALTDVDKAAIAVRELADFLRRNPHSIVAGTKPRGTNP